MAIGLAPFANPTARTSDCGSERAIAHCSAGRNAAERGANGVLEGRAVCFDREIGGGIEIAVKISGERMCGMRRPRSFAQSHRVPAVVAKQQLQHARFVVIPSTDRSRCASSVTMHIWPVGVSICSAKKVCTALICSLEPSIPENATS